ncbi:MAG: c-type cytochrome [Chitinophagaceae bacterium]|nr:MAG: c-type cytochrome [Chitinophagaceae bacterium]
MQARYFKSVRLAITAVLILVAISLAKFIVNLLSAQKNSSALTIKDPHSAEPTAWQPPDTSQIPASAEGDLIRYGRSLVAKTSYYLGPKGKVTRISNGMNCQNCHLDAGTRIWGNNFSAVYSTYPQFRARSGTVESVYKRVNDCLERSLNGRKLDTSSREMQALAAYINWVGHNVPKHTKPEGSGVRTIRFLNRPADTLKGSLLYMLKCQRCHGKDGQGFLAPDSAAYLYPPLWGENSYNTGAGLFRLSHFAGYIRYNMPFDAPSNSSFLSDEEAWDIAAFVNSQPRPDKKFPEDWPDISRKPFDYPFGPYADHFSEQQHKLGIFAPIQQAKSKTEKGKGNGR